MDRYPINSDVTVTLPLQDFNGTAIEVGNISSLSYVVKDGEDTTIAGPTGVAVPGSGNTVTFTVPGSANAALGARQIELSIVATAGTFMVESIYAVVDNALTVLTNSFQTFAQALVTALDMPDMSGWMSASDSAKRVGLIEAYTRLTRIPFLVRWPSDVEDQSIYALDEIARITPNMWPIMTTAQFATYPAEFIAALRKAQIAEANVILTPNPIEDKRRTGLMSETIGESSMMFRPGVRPIDSKVSRVALDYLSGYIDYNMSLTRA